MIEQIKLALQTEKVQLMNNPTILMDSSDFEEFKMKIECKDNNSILFDKFPVVVNKICPNGTAFIYDDKNIYKIPLK